MKKIFLYFVLFLILFSSTGCGPGKLISPTLTPKPSQTSTFTPTLTSTSTPTLTPTSTPTKTPTPTFTPTPYGGGVGKIVFIRDEKLDNFTVTNIYLKDLSLKTETNLTKNTDPNVGYNAPAISPNGEEIVYSRYFNDAYNSELFTIDINGENNFKISPAPQYKGRENVGNYLQDIHPAWSPDGQKIIFSSNRHRLDLYYPDYEIYSIDLSTYEIQQITNSYLDSLHPWFSPDGTQITFMSNRDGYWNIYIMDIDGKNLVKVTSGTSSNRFPKWSNDGDKVIFHSDRDGSFDLFIYNLSDKSLTKITNTPASNATASFSPDNQWISFASDQTGVNNIYILNLITQELIQVTTGKVSDGYSDWSK